MKINLACGDDIREGYLNIDQVNFKGVDKVCDIEKGLKFIKDNSVDEILAKHCFEHFHNPEFVLQECSRILKKDGKLFICVPHYLKSDKACAITHCRYYNENSFRELEKYGLKTIEVVLNKRGDIHSEIIKL